MEIITITGGHYSDQFDSNPVEEWQQHNQQEQQHWQKEQQQKQETQWQQQAASQPYQQLVTG